MFTLNTFLSNKKYSKGGAKTCGLSSGSRLAAVKFAMTYSKLKDPLF